VSLTYERNQHSVVVKIITSNTSFLPVVVYFHGVFTWYLSILSLLEHGDRLYYVMLCSIMVLVTPGGFPHLWILMCKEIQVDWHGG